MNCVVGIDLGSTTTKAVLLDLFGRPLGRGITNSRSNYAVASTVARDEALTAARFTLLRRELDSLADLEAVSMAGLADTLSEQFRLEVHLAQLAALRQEIKSLLGTEQYGRHRAQTEAPAMSILDDCVAAVPDMYAPDAQRLSDFFRDLAGAAFMTGAEEMARRGEAPFERLVAVFDRAILNVETSLHTPDFERLLNRALERVYTDASSLSGNASLREQIGSRVSKVSGTKITEVGLVGTGYGRQTLPFPNEAVRSEILCHGRGAHRICPSTRTVLDIGGQDTKAIQLDDRGLVTSFQMNDRCAAGCGRYLGYIADELNIGLHELGPLALQAKRVVSINSTCTVFAGAELRERLSLGQRREDILAGLHRAIMIRAMSLIARSGGITNEFTFTGGVCKNPMATKVLRELVTQNYGEEITINAHPDSIYMGALGAALYALDDVNRRRAGSPVSIFSESVGTETEGMRQ